MGALNGAIAEPVVAKKVAAAIGSSDVEESELTRTRFVLRACGTPERLNRGESIALLLDQPEFRNRTVVPLHCLFACVAFCGTSVDSGSAVLASWSRGIL